MSTATSLPDVSEQSVEDWLADYDRAEREPHRPARGLRLPPLAERYRCPPGGGPDVAAERRTRELLAGYRALLVEHAGLLARTTPDAELAAILDADAPLAGLPATVVADLRPVVAEARRLAVRAGLRSAP